MRPTRTKTLSLEREAPAQVIASFLDFEKSLVESPGGHQMSKSFAITRSNSVYARSGSRSRSNFHPDALLKGGPETQEHKRFDFHALTDRGRADEDPATRWSAAARAPHPAVCWWSDGRSGHASYSRGRRGCER
jgi:hypothetical protein